AIIARLLSVRKVVTRPNFCAAAAIFVQASIIVQSLAPRLVHTYPPRYPHDCGKKRVSDDPRTRPELCTQEGGCPQFMGVYPRRTARVKSAPQPAISRLAPTRPPLFPCLRVIHILCG